MKRRDVLAGSAGVLAAAALPTPLLAQSADESAETLLTATADALAALYPERAAELGIDKGPRVALKHRLNDRSPEGQRKMQAHLGSTLAAIGRIDTAQLSPEMRTNIEVVQASYQLGLAGLRFGFGDVSVGGWRNSPYAVVQNVGAYLDVPRMLDAEHQIASSEDADAYLDRLESYAEELDGETERLKAAAARGIIAPDFLLDKAIAQQKLARGGNTAGWGLVTSLANRTAGMSGDYGQRAWLLCIDKVAPALDRQIAELERHLRRARPEAGMWKFGSDGEAYYAWALRAATTTTMSPDEVHRMGLEQIREIQAEMDGILKGLGFSQGSVGARMIALGKDPRFLFPDNDQGRAQIMALLQDRIADIRRRMPNAFHTLVPGNVQVRRLPPEEEPGAPAAYGGAGSVDGTVPGKFWINLRTTGLHTRYSLPTLAYHESIPGHVWQGEYSNKLPLIRALLSFNAYSEGWALYGEQLANELGVYEGDPVGRLGYLQSIGFRACRLVVDSGLHAKRWTRQQAIDWFMQTNGSGAEEVSGEVDRYCSWPGQACGYKVGHSEINRLRERAKAALGSAYDFKAFNDAVVIGGNVPMTVLGHVVDRHVAARKG